MSGFGQTHSDPKFRSGLRFHSQFKSGLPYLKVWIPVLEDTEYVLSKLYGKIS
jgi:hypothetical protein